MIDRTALLADLKNLVTRLEDDIRERASTESSIDDALRQEHAEALEAGRTAASFEVFRDDLVTQSAVAWVLGCVFVRFLEDNAFLDEPDAYVAGRLRPRRLLSGASQELLKLARDQSAGFFEKHPEVNEREYLMSVFREIAGLPGMGGLYDERHNLLWKLTVSGDGARGLLEFWRKPHPDTGLVRHDFTEPAHETRFLGDLYQDLSASARDKYALLQTPEFVEEFILDRTLEPAIAEFGYQAVRLIDPTCGSGHFLLGAFRRLLERWTRDEPGMNAPALAQRALNGVYGVDLNPFATAIARFRLLIAALRASGTTRLSAAHDFRINLATGDSLLHGQRFSAIAGTQATLDPAQDPLRHVYLAEDRDELRRILGQQYHAVVGNPPYIAVKDKALNEAYRHKYGACHMKYSLAVPFMERFFELALLGRGGDAEGAMATPAGFVGTITSNGFMKRAFGKKLIETFVPRWDLTHVIDTAGAYIPGHGTPTVILLGRNRSPVASTLRAVMGIRGEPKTPADPSRGLVWSAITSQVDQPGSLSEWVSVSDAAIAAFKKHPWSIGGGGAAELKELLDERAERRLGDMVASIGFGAILGEDDAFGASKGSIRLRLLPVDLRRPLVEGEFVRDWAVDWETEVLFPYTSRIDLVSELAVARWLWPLRTLLSARADFGKRTYRECGRPYWEYHQIPTERNRTPLSIAFAAVATHNHFALDRGGKVFNRSAPIIKLLPGATEGDHLLLLALLNSSTACFWMRQVFPPKGGAGIGRGIQDEAWETRLDFDGTKLQLFPMPAVDAPATSSASLPLDAISAVCSGSPITAQTRALPTPSMAGIDPWPSAATSTHASAQLRARELAIVLEDQGGQSGSLLASAILSLPSATVLGAARDEAHALAAQSIALQEELDWAIYAVYGLVKEDVTLAMDRVPGLCLGERAFEILMARRVEAGELRTTWFERHGATPITEIPVHWPEEYRRLVERRIKLIETNREIFLIEQPEYKRRWNTKPWEERQKLALRSWLLDRLELPAYWPSIELQSCAQLADRTRCDREFMQVAELYRGRADFDVVGLVNELVESEAVPFLPALRYKDTGLRKRAVWERVWERQRLEDAIDESLPIPDDPVRKADVELARARLKSAETGTIEAPPKYTSADLLRADYWRLRGKLDVPKERFVSYPGCSRDNDSTLVVAWAGWDHLQQARALGAYYLAMKEQESWDAARLTPLLAGILDLLPWIVQWHNVHDPEAGMGMGEYFQGFIQEEARALGLTPERIQAWTPDQGAPPGTSRRRGRTPQA